MKRLTPLALLLTFVFPVGAQSPEPITPGERLQWAIHGTVGPPNLAGGVISAGWGTMMNHPSEYGPGWKGFGKRYGMRLTGSATSNAMEAGLGAMWGEDPRYVRSLERGFAGRLRHSVASAFTAYNRDGEVVPAYARFAAIPGSNFLSNTWRPDSEAKASDAVVRTGLGFAARIVANTFEEFWPDVKRVFRH